MKTISFIGGGRITRIFLQAFKNCNFSFGKILVYDNNPTVLQSLRSEFPGITASENVTGTGAAELVFIALHPPVIMETLAKIKESLTPHTLLVSLAPKITALKISEALDGFQNIARMNPSASTIVCQGVNPVYFGKGVTTALKEDFMATFQHLGYTPEVDEAKIEAYAVISAMGHTYFFFQLNKLKELAVDFGMEEKEAREVISQMLKGTTETLFNSGMDYPAVANLVPVKPLGEVEETISGYYEQYLKGIFAKIKP